MMANNAKGQRHERVVFSFIRNGFKITFFEDNRFWDDEEQEEFKLLSSEDRFDNLIEETILGREC